MPLGAGREACLIAQHDAPRHRSRARRARSRAGVGRKRESCGHAKGGDADREDGRERSAQHGV